jgi:hypothetical protein
MGGMEAHGRCSGFFVESVGAFFADSGAVASAGAFTVADAG